MSDCNLIFLAFGIAIGICLGIAARVYWEDK
jgi:hypothetical protein